MDQGDQFLLEQFESEWSKHTAKVDAINATPPVKP